MKNGYPKIEKLKSRTQINLLFTEGKTVSKYPLRLVYAEINDLEQTDIKIGVSVSKKYFKKAVDRNYYKRVLREVYRLNKLILLPALCQKKYAIMFLYQTKERLNYEEIDVRTKELFEKFVKQL